MPSGVRGSAARLRERHASKAREELARYLERQRDATLSRKAADDGLPSRSRWDQRLTELLARLGVLTATAFGTMTAERLSTEYDEDRTLRYWAVSSGYAAARINDETDAALAASDDLAGTFDAFVSRFDRIAGDRTTFASSWGSEEAVSQSGGQSRKVWAVTSGNPRPSHAEMDGEEAAVGEPFSNGMLYPGDPAGGPDETAGCTCLLDIVPPV